MKKTLIFFLVALFVASCDDSNKDLKMKVIDLTVKSSDWIESIDKDSLNRYYSCHFSMPEINSAVYNNGSVLSYILINNAQQVLPYVRHYEDVYGALWTRTVDFDYALGGMNFYVTNSDFAVDQPIAMDFRVVLMWP